MQAGRFVQALFSFEPPPGTIELCAPVSLYRGIMHLDGGITCNIACARESIPSLSALPQLCRTLLALGCSDGALQIRTHRGEPVCFVGSITATARTDDDGTVLEQLSLVFS